MSDSSMWVSICVIIAFCVGQAGCIYFPLWRRRRRISKNAKFLCDLEDFISSSQECPPGTHVLAHGSIIKITFAYCTGHVNSMQRSKALTSIDIFTYSRGRPFYQMSVVPLESKLEEDFRKAKRIQDEEESKMRFPFDHPRYGLMDGSIVNNFGVDELEKKQGEGDE